MSTAFSILRFSPAVAMLDVVTWLARRLEGRCCAVLQSPGVQRQLKALHELAAGLALLAPHQADEAFLIKAIPEVNALMTAAAPRRVQQLKLAVALEERLRVMSRVAPAPTAASRRAAEEADQLFDKLGALIGVDDFAKVFDEADGLAARRTVGPQ